MLVHFWLTDVGCWEATSVSLCRYLSVGQLNNGKWPACFARTVCMRIGPFRTGNRAGARVRSFDLAKEARQMAKFKRCPFTKTIANCSNSFCHFHLISSVSRPQRPLIMFVSCAHGINTARHSHILNPGKMYSVTSFIF